MRINHYLASFYMYKEYPRFMGNEKEDNQPKRIRAKDKLELAVVMSAAPLPQFVECVRV